MYYLGVQIPHMHLHVNVGDLPPNLPEWVKPTVARLASATKVQLGQFFLLDSVVTEF
jgi:hypothetical protein